MPQNLPEEPIFPDETIAELKRKASEAKKLAEMKSNFLAMVSHEIRTPLQTIYGLLELISDEEEPDRIHSMVDTAKISAGDLLEILDDVLDSLKMDANKLKLDMFEVPVRLLVRGILEALAFRAQDANVTLMDDIEKDVPAVVIGDPKRLRQILMNLCTNAVKFTKQGTVTVRVTRQTEKIDGGPDGLGLRFEVIDTGIGMGDDVIARLFEPFMQADNPSTRKHGGTGLGLSISKKLVDLMSGEIGVRSEAGAGSQFWFEIPTREVGTDLNPDSLPDLEGVSVLSVDSHPLGSKEIATSLQSMGAKVESVSTYEDGLELARKMPFNVAVVDQSLPDGLGVNLIQELYVLRPFMGLVMYTVRDDPGMTQTLKSLGATYLTKPASRIGLGKTVKDAANIKRASSLEHEGPVRILIAEDTDSVRDILRRQCEKLNVDVVFATNGTQAREYLTSETYSLFITDLHMPDVDGYSLVRDIRKKEQETGQHLPVIVLTADVQMASREAYLEHGFDESLIKPVSLGHLRQLLIRWGLLDEEKLKGVVTARPSKEAQYHSSKTVSAIDRECVIGQIGAFDENAIEMLQSFLKLTDPLITKLAEAEGRKDYAALTEIAHSLKGAARSACCNVLGQFAEEIQKTAEERRPCANLVVSAVREFGRVRREIEELGPIEA